MTAGMQIWPLTAVRERVLGNPSVTSVKIHPGHVLDNKGFVISNIQKPKEGQWPLEQFDWFEKHNGTYTVILMPTKEIMWVDSKADDPDTFQFRQSLPLNGILLQPEQVKANQYANMEMMTLVNRLLEAEKKVIELTEANKNIKEELKEYQDNRNRFNMATGDFFDGVLVPRFMEMFGGNKSQSNTQQRNLKQRPMGGQTEEVEDNLENIDWQNMPVDSMENALTILVAAFGVDTIMKLAAKLQTNPNMIGMVKGFANT